MLQSADFLRTSTGAAPCTSDLGSFFMMACRFRFDSAHVSCQQPVEIGFWLERGRGRGVFQARPPLSPWSPACWAGKSLIFEKMVQVSHRTNQRQHNGYTNRGCTQHCALPEVVQQINFLRAAFQCTCCIGHGLGSVTGQGRSQVGNGTASVTRWSGSQAGVGHWSRARAGQVGSLQFSICLLRISVCCKFVLRGSIANGLPSPSLATPGSCAANNSSSLLSRTCSNGHGRRCVCCCCSFCSGSRCGGCLKFHDTYRHAMSHQ